MQYLAGKNLVGKSSDTATQRYTSRHNCRTSIASSITASALTKKGQPISRLPVCYLKGRETRLLVERIAVLGVFAEAVATDGAVRDTDVDKPEYVYDGNQQKDYLPSWLFYVVLTGNADTNHVDGGHDGKGQTSVNVGQH